MICRQTAMRSTINKICKLATSSTIRFQARALTTTAKAKWNERVQSFKNNQSAWGNGSSWDVQHFLEEVCYSFIQEYDDCLPCWMFHNFHILNYTTYNLYIIYLLYLTNKYSKQQGNKAILQKIIH